MRCVTVPGAGSGSSPPILVYLEGGLESLSHRLANIIREQLELIGHHERKVDGMAPSVSGAAKSWDVIS
jgi:hypothetical protein